MAFERIENCKTPSGKTAACPDNGVTVRPRAINTAKRKAQWIEVVIGKRLAAALVLRNDSVGVAMMFGTGDDAGKIAIHVDAGAGTFAANKRKNGTYAVNISADTADGLFTLNFPRFAIDDIEVEHVAHKPPLAIFAVPAAMLGVED